MKDGELMKRALLIEFDLKTGERAGGINNRDPKLLCHGWQDLESEPAREIRLVEDDRDLSQYEGVTGVTILEGEEAINQAIDSIPPRVGITDMNLLVAHMKEKGLSLDLLAGKNMREVAQFAFQNNLAGVIERKPEKIEKV